MEVTATGSLPEGFFDDPKVDAKVLNLFRCIQCFCLFWVHRYKLVLSKLAIAVIWPGSLCKL